MLGGGGPGRPWADGSDVVHIVPNSRNLPGRILRDALPDHGRAARAEAATRAAPGRRGGLGYDKRIRALERVELLSNADRSLLNTYGVNGGKAGRALLDLGDIAGRARSASYPGWRTT